MMVLNLTRGKGAFCVPLRLPASPADIEAAYAKLDEISMNDRQTRVASAVTGVGALDRWLRDRQMDSPGDYIELSELSEKINRMSDTELKTFDGALTGAAFETVKDVLRIADSLDNYIFIHDVTTEKELGRFLVDSGYKDFPENVKPYLDYAAIGIEYHAEHDGAFTADGYTLRRSSADPILTERQCPVVHTDLPADQGLDNAAEPLKPQMLKLYMPLQADFHTFDRHGGLDEESWQFDGRELFLLQDTILAALVKERKPEEAERGIMHWYGENDSVDRKVLSVVFTVEGRANQLWGVAECQVVGTLSSEELATLKDYITSQASEGFGRGFEQHGIRFEDGELFVHLWDSEYWSLHTEEECFGPFHVGNLPDMCWSVLPGEGTLICIKRGESGYYPSDWNTKDRQRNRQIADDANEARGVTKAQEQAMLYGSMFGWNSPAADPKLHEDTSQQKGEMTFG